MRWKGDKGKAWESVKKYTRRVSMDCYTCPKKNLTDANAGHYQPVAVVGSNNRLSWEPRFIHTQCSHCNGAGQGQQVQYRAHLVKDYGEKVVQEYDKRVYGKYVDPIKNWKEIEELFNNL